MRWDGLLVLVFLSPLFSQTVPIDVLFLGGPPGEHHGHRAFFDTLANYFQDRDVNLVFTDQKEDLNPDTLLKYDAVFIYHNLPEITDEQDSALFAFVENGGGVVAVHLGITWGNSARYPGLVGARFGGHGEGTFGPFIVDSNHPAMEGVETYEAWDESFYFTELAGDRIVLQRRPGTPGAEEESDWTWVREQSDGRVYYTGGGHDERVWSQEAYKYQLYVALRWVTNTQPGSVSSGNWKFVFRSPGGSRQILVIDGTSLPVKGPIVIFNLLGQNRDNQEIYTGILFNPAHPVHPVKKNKRR
jgi:type 1 glutamine amidotransferase